MQRMLVQLRIEAVGAQQQVHPLALGQPADENHPLTRSGRYERRLEKRRVDGVVDDARSFAPQTGARTYQVLQRARDEDHVLVRVEVLAGLAGMVGKHHRRALGDLAEYERQEGYPLMGGDEG